MEELDPIKIKVVLNKDYGGFGLSEEAKNLYSKKKNYKLTKYVWTDCSYKKAKYFETGDSEYRSFYSFISDLKELNESEDKKIFRFYDIKRTDPVLIEVVEELKEKANGEYACLEIEEIEIEPYIDNYDGIETVMW